MGANAEELLVAAKDAAREDPSEENLALLKEAKVAVEAERQDERGGRGLTITASANGQVEE